MLRVLHTSDWHIGKTLFSKKRYDEFEEFFDWLVEVIRKEEVDVLLISGDIFDTTTPSNKALKLYYSFLSATSQTSCRKIVITGGNHDSATSLDAPKELLEALHISVVGAAREDIAEEIITVNNVGGEPQLVVCAVPYLRERDIRVVDAGDTLADKAEKLKSGVKEHYVTAVSKAKEILSQGVPLIVMGHLFAANALSSGDDSERELYVGSLAHVDIGELPDNVDYYALGHLHIKQRVGGSEYKRYSGSPLPMSFAEAAQDKAVLLLDFEDGNTTPEIKEIAIPVFQRLEKISGGIESLLGRITELKKEDTSIWIEVEYTGSEICSDLKDQIEQAVANTQLEVCRVRNNTGLELSLEQIAQNSDIELAELDHARVFEMCLDEHELGSVQAAELKELYSQVIHGIFESDINAE